MFLLSRVASRVPWLTGRVIPTACQRCNASQFEPPYLDETEPQVPEYPLINVQMKSHDFVVLEHYAKWVHRSALNMGIEVTDAWASPCEKLRIQRFKPMSDKVESEYKLSFYERNVQLADLSSVLAPLFMEVIQHGLPEGVELNVQEHQPEHTQVRYIPDYDLRDLETKLDEMGGPSKTKK